MLDGFYGGLFQILDICVVLTIVRIGGEVDSRLHSSDCFVLLFSGSLCLLGTPNKHSVAWSEPLGDALWVQTLLT